MNPNNSLTIQMNIPIIILIIVFIFIIARQIGRFKFGIWQVMLAGALAVLVTGQITPEKAVASINQDVMLFLCGMFVIGAAIEQSGYLSSLSGRLFSKAKNTDMLILMFLFVFGILSAFLMNDTLAIIGTPLVLIFSKRYGLSPKLMLLCLAFSVTTGSVMSPIGNPQNLLIALDSNMPNPFLTFFGYLAIPTLINLVIVYLILKLFYKNQFLDFEIKYEEVIIKDTQLATLSKISLTLLTSLIAVKILIVSLHLPIDIKLTYVALVSALPILVFSNKRKDLIKKIDWQTLVFFASMFVLMKSVWDTGFFQGIITEMHLNLASVPVIFVTGNILSQFISNVPFVALYMPVLAQHGAATNEVMALAAASTIAGNFLILGAASNVIIIQNAEKKGETLTFFEFAKVGTPITILNVLVYLGYFSILAAIR